MGKYVRRAVVLSIAVCLIAGSGCSHRKDARAIWSDVIAKCANNDLLGPNVLYFGPSNNLGPGSIWRQTADGGYQPRWRFDQYLVDQTVVNQGQKFTCTGASKSSSKFSSEVALQTSLLPIDASASADFSKASSISVAIGSVAWVEVLGGPYELSVKKLPDNDPAKKELFDTKRLVLTRALRVTEMDASLEFSRDNALKLKGKYNGPLPSSGTGSVAVGLNAQWKGENTLHLTSQTDFFLAGELRPFTATGLAGPGEVFGPVVTGVSTAKVVPAE